MIETRKFRDSPDRAVLRSAVRLGATLSESDRWRLATQGINTLSVTRSAATVRLVPRTLAGDYDTVAGLMLHQFHRLPDLGDSFTAEGYRFEVIDLDDRRIDKVLVTRL